MRETIRSLHTLEVTNVCQEAEVAQHRAGCWCRESPWATPVAAAVLPLLRFVPRIGNKLPGATRKQCHVSRGRTCVIVTAWPR